MRTENEINRENAKELSRLILANPTMRVIAWIDSEGISDEYDFWGGNLGKPEIQTIAYSEETEHYIEKDGNAYEDCCAYYGSWAVDDWDDEAIKRKAQEIPWDEVIAAHVSAV